jgi:guanylate kinase
LQSNVEVPQIPREPPLLIVLSGPSGAGKDSICEMLLHWQPLMHRIVTVTTRNVRPGEVDGVDYHFISTPDFEKILASGGFVEHAKVYDRYYGVPRIEIEDPLAQGRDAIARVDVQGAATLKRLFPDALLIFIAPPSIPETLERMKRRDHDTPEDQTRRAEEAHTEMEAAKDFDYVVVNETGRLEDTARRVVEIIVAEKQGRGRRPPAE